MRVAGMRSTIASALALLSSSESHWSQLSLDSFRCFSKNSHELQGLKAIALCQCAWALDPAGYRAGCWPTTATAWRCRSCSEDATSRAEQWGKAPASESYSMSTVEHDAGAWLQKCPCRISMGDISVSRAGICWTVLLMQRQLWNHSMTLCSSCSSIPSGCVAVFCCTRPFLCCSDLLSCSEGSIKYQDKLTAYGTAYSRE